MDSFFLSRVHGTCDAVFRTVGRWSCVQYLIATIGPAAINASESLSTLLFASRCMRVASNPVVNEEVDYAELSAQLQMQIAGMERECVFQVVHTGVCVLLVVVGLTCRALCLWRVCVVRMMDRKQQLTDQYEDTIRHLHAQIESFQQVA